LDLREKLIHESLKLFSLKGFLNTSIEDILTQAGASKGGLYNHFKSKDDLFWSVLAEARRIWRRRVLQGLEEEAGPLEKVKRLLENYRDRYLKDVENIPGGCVFVTLSVELDDQRPDFAREINRGFTGLRDLIRRLLDQARESGQLRPGVDTDSAADLVFTGMLGASVRYGTDKSAQALNRSLSPLLDWLDGLKVRDGSPGEP